MQNSHNYIYFNYLYVFRIRSDEIGTGLANRDWRKLEGEQTALESRYKQPFVGKTVNLKEDLP